METMHADDIDIVRKVPLKCLSFRRFHRCLTSDDRTKLSRRSVCCDTRDDVCGFHGVDDQVGKTRDGMTRSEGNDGRSCERILAEVGWKTMFRQTDARLTLKFVHELGIPLFFIAHVDPVAHQPVPSTLAISSRLQAALGQPTSIHLSHL